MRPPDGAEYPHVLRGTAPWRSVLGIALAVAALLVVPALISQAVLTGAGPDADLARRAEAFDLPVGLLAVNLGTAALALVAWLLVAGLHREQPGWLSSVRPGMRWRYLLVCVPVAVIVLVGGQLLASPTLGWAPQPGFAAFLLVILLTSPLQALGEELIFRGYLLQAFGSLASRAWVGPVAAAVVFALFHGVQNSALFVDRLLLGLIAGVLVWRTGGLEAAVVAHAVGNVATYTLAGATTSVAAVRAVDGIGWAAAAFDVAGLAVFAVVAVLVAWRMGLRTRIEPALVRA